MKAPLRAGISYPYLRYVDSFWLARQPSPLYWCLGVNMGTHALRVAALQAYRSGSVAFSARQVAGPLVREFLAAWRVAGDVPGWLTEVNAAAMFRAIAATRPARIVEIGSYLGKSTVFFAQAMKILDIDGRVTAIDPHTGDRQHLERLGIAQMPSLALFRQHIAATRSDDVIDVLVEPSEQVGARWTEPIDLLYDDGWHSYESVYNNGVAFLPHLTPDGVVFFDDYMRYRGVHDAVVQLDRDGYFHLWGDFFSQAYGGADTRAIPELRTASVLTRSPLHFFDRKPPTRQ